MIIICWLNTGSRIEFAWVVVDVLAQPRGKYRTMDLFIVPTIGFDLLYVLVIVRLERRDLVWINVTANPTAEWIARQIA